MADIFVSYTSSDRDWAFWIAKELEALGHTPHVHEWEIEGGDDIMAWMVERHDKADFILGVVSDDWLRAAYSKVERMAGEWAAAHKRPGFMLYVVVRPATLPTIGDHRKRIEIFGVPDSVKRQRLKDYLASAARPLVPDPSPDPVFAVSNIPIRVPEHFLGREDSLAAIETALRRHEGRVAITALHGLRGVGKTTLAAAYAERHRGDYRATWWIRAQTETTMRADLVGLGVRLGWVAAEEKEESALAAVMQRLRHEAEGILLIYDNAADVETLRSYLPRGGAARVLVTSNAHTWRGVAEPVEISLWPKDVGADYLIARTGRDSEREHAKALSEVLGGLPLAHEQAAAYCERLEISLAEYRKRFEAAPASMLDTERDAPAEYHDRLTVAKTFALAIDEAAKLHPAAESLIVHAAQLVPEPIPIFLVRRLHAVIRLTWLRVFLLIAKRFLRLPFDPTPQPSEKDKIAVEDALAALRAFALIDRVPIEDERDPAISTDCIRLHRLVRQVARSRREGAARDRARRHLMLAVAADYPKQIFHDLETWPRARRLDALAFELVNGGDNIWPRADALAGNLLIFAAQYRHYVLGAYSQAKLLYQRGLAMNEKAYGAEHPKTIVGRSCLAELLLAKGDFNEARPLIERDLRICDKIFGPDHPETATSLGNLAHLLLAQGDFAGARPLYERVLTIREKVLSDEQSTIATSLNNIAVALQSQGKLSEARPLYERALAIREKAWGLGHPGTAAILANLAILLQAQGDLAAARPRFERALAIREKVLGAEHPDTAMSLDHLAGLLQAQGDLAGARPLYERTLAIREKVLGAEHSNTAMSLDHLAGLLHDQSDLAGARPLHDRALAIREKVLSPEHPDTATSLNNLGGLLQAQGDLAGARSLYDRALEIREKILGPEHPDTANSLSNFGRLLRDLGEREKAEQLFQRAIAVGNKVLGADHSFTQRYQSHYARLLLMTDRAAGALQLGQAALATHERITGPQSSWTKDSVRVTADALDALGRGDEAAALREKYGITQSPSS